MTGANATEQIADTTARAKTYSPNEDQKPRRRTADLDDFTLANCQIFCSRCDDRNPALAISA
jgi:hypothetical protein